MPYFSYPVDEGGQRHAQRVQGQNAHAIGIVQHRLHTPLGLPLATLTSFAVLSYRHMNLHGEYDFSDQPLPAEAPFDMDLIAAWQPPAKSEQG